MTRRDEDPLARSPRSPAHRLGAGVALPCRTAVGRADARRCTVSVGRQPWAAGNSPITQYMMDNNLFEKQAAELGYKLTVDYRDYPSAMPQVEAFVGSNLDFGMWGNTPIIRGIAQQAALDRAQCRRGPSALRDRRAPRQSAIRNVQDLKGKTVGALLGGDPYNALSQILFGELGSGDPAANDIKIVNTPTQAQAATVPPGMDAAIVIYPAFLKAHRDDRHGRRSSIPSATPRTTTRARQARAAASSCHRSRSRRSIRTASICTARSGWCRTALLEKHPEVVVAFIAAQQEAGRGARQDGSPDEVSQISSRSTGTCRRELGAKVVKDEVLFIRGWVWPTEGDAGALARRSRSSWWQGGLIDQPLTWDQVRDASPRTGRRLCSRPGSDGQVAGRGRLHRRKRPSDLRGLPVWDMDKWRRVNDPSGSR